MIFAKNSAGNCEKTIICTLNISWIGWWVGRFQIWFSDIRPPGAKVNQTKPDYLKFICIIHFVYLKSMYSLFQVVNYEADPIHGFHAEGAGVPKYPH